MPCASGRGRRKGAADTTDATADGREARKPVDPGMGRRECRRWPSRGWARRIQHSAEGGASTSSESPSDMGARAAVTTDAAGRLAGRSRDRGAPGGRRRHWRVQLVASFIGHRACSGPLRSSGQLGPPRPSWEPDSYLTARGDKTRVSETFKAEDDGASAEESISELEEAGTPPAGPVQDRVAGTGFCHRNPSQPSESAAMPRPAERIQRPEHDPTIPAGITAALYGLAGSGGSACVDASALPFGVRVGMLGRVGPGSNVNVRADSEPKVTEKLGRNESAQLR